MSNHLKVKCRPCNNNYTLQSYGWQMRGRNGTSSTFIILVKEEMGSSPLHLVGAWLSPLQQKLKFLGTLKANIS